MNKQKQLNIEQQVWYIYIDQQPKGPLAIRDLDVLIRTNQITSKTLGWKTGMKEWKPLIEIEQIKQSILQSSKEIIQINKKRTSMFDQKTSKFGPKVEQKPENTENNENQMMVNKDQNNDPLAILASTVENLVKNSFIQNSDGKWNIYDETKKQWFTQNQQPKEQIQSLKNELLNKLKAELFNPKKDFKRKRENIPKQAEENLTKQELQKREKNRKKAKKVAEKKKQKWYNPKVNTFVYISGLPLDITVDEIKDFAAKAGVIRIDHQTGKQKIKIYKDDQGLPKGDAAVSYAKQQSVQIALQMLNEREIKPGHIVKIQRAQFNQKNEQYIRRDLKKANKINLIIAKKNQERQLTWDQNDEGEGLRIVILKHMFTLDQIQNQQFIRQTKQDIKLECQKIGPITRIRFFQTHPQGVVQVKFKEQVDAEKCISMMNGRFFDGRQIQCEYWDGQTNYKTTGVVKQIQNQRINNFGNWLQELQSKVTQIQKEAMVEQVKQKQLTLEQLETLQAPKN